MKIQVGFPVSSNRIVPNYSEKIAQGQFSAISINTVVCKVRVSELTEEENDRGTLCIEYTEDYSEESTFSEVMQRAEKYGCEYCKKLGIGANLPRR